MNWSITLEPHSELFTILECSNIRTAGSKLQVAFTTKSVIKQYKKKSLYSVLDIPRQDKALNLDVTYGKTGYKSVQRNYSN